MGHERTQESEAQWRRLLAYREEVSSLTAQLGRDTLAPNKRHRCELRLVELQERLIPRLERDLGVRKV